MSNATDTSDFVSDPGDRALLWSGDTGVLGEQARRAMLVLIRGPYLSGADAPALWSALLAEETSIRSRLHELFLELTVDRVGEFAFVRNVTTDEIKVPSAVRATALSFMDTAMLLVLRQILLANEGEGRVIVGKEEVFEQLLVYRTPDRDETDFDKRMNASWQNMKNKMRVIHTSGAEERAEISPVLRLIVDAEQINAIGAEYRRIAARETGSTVGGLDDTASVASDASDTDADSGDGEGSR